MSTELEMAARNSKSEDVRESQDERWREKCSNETTDALDVDVFFIHAPMRVNYGSVNVSSVSIWVSRHRVNFPSTDCTSVVSWAFDLGLSTHVPPPFHGR